MKKTAFLQSYSYSFDKRGNRIKEAGKLLKKCYTYDATEITNYYTGHPYDPVLDLYFAEARFYDAGNRQWMSVDPIKSGYNWYQYCGSNPATYWDPTGMATASSPEEYFMQFECQDESGNWWTFTVQMAIGFSPLGVAVDVGILVYDVATGASWQMIAMDVIAIAPVAGDAAKVLKHGDEAVDVARHVGKIGDAAGASKQAMNAAETVIENTDEAIAVVDDAAGAVNNATKNLPSGTNPSSNVDLNGSVTKNKNVDGTVAETTTKDKPYSKNRPSYGKDQVEQVWENAKDPVTGKVYDPTGVEIVWDKSKPRNGQWDMGHIPDEKYSEMHKQYMDGIISKEEFLEWYRDPKNYRPELPSTNRSHKYE